MIDKRPVRYIIVGALCAVIHNFIVIGSSFFGIHYVVSTLISYFVVVIIGFFSHTYFTFSQTMTVPSFLRYASAMVMNYPLSILAMFLLVNVAGLSVPIASPLATVILMAWNYFASRWAILARSRAPTKFKTDDS